MSKTEMLLHAAIKLLSIGVLQFCLNSTKDRKTQDTVAQEIKGLMSRLEDRLSGDR